MWHESLLAPEPASRLPERTEPPKVVSVSALALSRIVREWHSERLICGEQALRIDWVPGPKGHVGLVVHYKNPGLGDVHYVMDGREPNYPDQAR